MHYLHSLVLKIKSLYDEIYLGKTNKQINKSPNIWFVLVLKRLRVRHPHFWHVLLSVPDK